jgi:hypothetical protein
MIKPQVGPRDGLLENLPGVKTRAKWKLFFMKAEDMATRAHLLKKGIGSLKTGKGISHTRKIGRDEWYSGDYKGGGMKAKELITVLFPPNGNVPILEKAGVLYSLKDGRVAFYTGGLHSERDFLAAFVVDDPRPYPCFLAVKEKDGWRWLPDRELQAIALLEELGYQWDAKGEKWAIPEGIIPGVPIEIEYTREH